jgi:hypothetical protein
MQTGAKTQTAQQLKKKLRDCPPGSTVGTDIGDRWTHVAVMGATASYSSKSASRVVSRMCAG